MTVAVEQDPAEAGFDAQRLARIDRHFQRYVDDGKLPGFLSVIARDGRIVHVARAGLREMIRPGAIWRAFNATLAMAAVAGTANLITGGNYMFLRAKPSRASQLDDMGPWPIYIGVAAALALVLFALLAALARRVSHDGSP